MRLSNDQGPDAYERVVERLLNSPRYGERWAQHWLDVVRYADTHGFEVNTERPNAWPYRDYVIESFNNDTPYDRFIREQIVGDALEQDAATGLSHHGVGAAAGTGRPGCAFDATGSAGCAGRNRRQHRADVSRPERGLRPLP